MAGAEGPSERELLAGGHPTGGKGTPLHTEPDNGKIRFTVMADIRPNYNQPVLPNIESGVRTPRQRERESLSRCGFHFADPSGSKRGAFVVKVHTAPLDIRAGTLHSGRTFITANVLTSQQGSPRCAGIALLDATATDLVRPAAAMPRVDPPHRLRSLAVPGTEFHVRDMRVVDDAYDPDRVGPPELFVWTRFRRAPEHGYQLARC